MERTWAEIDAIEAGNLFRSGVPILDVREDDEWTASHIPDTHHIPLGQIPDRYSELPLGKILVICHLGGRSARAAAFLADHGYEAINIAGGMLAWELAGFEVLDANGAQGTMQ
ncbi:MAG: rhodanese-like domain-containing protein [Actinomycetes bacterium]